MTPREKLFSYGKIYDWEGSETLFLQAMKESISFHKKHCAIYDSFLQMHSFDEQSLKAPGDCKKIPPLPVGFLKQNVLLSVPKQNITVHATSSGTQGQKSQIFLDKDSIDMGVKMAVRAMWHHRLISPRFTNYVILGYEPKPGNTMGNVRLASGMTRFAPAKEKVYALKTLGNDYALDVYGVLKALEKFSKQRRPVRLMGFPAYLYFLIKAMEEKGMKPLKLHPKSVVLTGGGWKTHEQERLDKPVFHKLIQRWLGIQPQNCRDFYSAVEHSVAYPECEHHRMHVPIWSRVVVRDVKTLEPVGLDQPGFLSFVSPLVHSMPLSSVLMGDLGILKDGRKCPCDINTPYFQVLGRVGGKEAKSCAITALDHMKG